MKRFGAADRIAAGRLHDPASGSRAVFLGKFVSEPTDVVADLNDTRSYLYHGGHPFDLVPHRMCEVASVTLSRFELAPGALTVQVSFCLAVGGLGVLVMGTHQSPGAPAE